MHARNAVIDCVLIERDEILGLEELAVAALDELQERLDALDNDTTTNARCSTAGSCESE